MAESSTKPEIPESVKISARAVLLSKIGGVPIQRFPEDYKKLDGSHLDYKALGFGTLRQCLEAMPDVVRFQYSEQAGLLMLYGVADSKSYMSSAAKKAQFSRPHDGVKEKSKMIKGKKGGKNRDKSPKAPSKGPNEKGDASGGRASLRDSQRGSPHEKTGVDGEVHVARSQRGLYTVCVRCEEPITTSNRGACTEEIKELFAEQGDVVEQSFVRSLMFFRFQHANEAVDVIKKFNGRTMKNSGKICVTPGNERMPSKVPREGSLQSREDGHPERERGKAEQPTPIPVPLAENGHLDAEENDNFVEICAFNLTSSTTQDELMNHFRMFQPLRARICAKEISGPLFSKKIWYGFVSFNCIVAACNAQKALHGSRLNGHQIRLELAMSKSKAAAHPTEKAKGTPGGKVARTQDNHTNSVSSKGEGKSRRLNGNRETRPSSSRSGDEYSDDSISLEVASSFDLHSPPQILNEVPAFVDESPYAVRTHNSQSQDQQNTFERSPAKQEGLPRGRGRGAWLGGVSPSQGKGTPSNPPKAAASGEKKKLRPSLADLIGKLEEI